MTDKYMKRCSISLAIREMQITTTVRYYFILTKLSIIESTDIEKYWEGALAR